MKIVWCGALAVVAACSGSGKPSGIAPAAEDDAGAPAPLDAATPEAAVVDAAAIVPPPTVESAAECALSGIRSVTVPAVRTSPTSTRLVHRYRVFPAKTANAPTVVVVPGGPGGDIMHKSPTDDYALAAIPVDRFNIVYTDARGSGCNAYGPLAEPIDDVYRIEEVARDVVDVIKNEKLADYILYGVSFGTTAATVAAHVLEQEGGPPPKRVVLEGTLGRAMSSFAEYFSAFATEWTRVKPMLAPAWRTAFETEPWPTELYWTREQWAMFVSEQLIIGDIPSYGHILNLWLSRLSSKDPSAEAYVSAFMDAAAAAGRPGDLFETIACRELWGSWQAGREIRDGSLRAIGPDLCAGRAKTEPYDSAAFVLHAPITYFQGPFDPTTTPAYAAYHFDHQTAPRTLVTVPAAAHAPLTVGISGRGCAKEVWAALDAAPQTLPAVLAACSTTGAPITVRTAP